EEDAFVTILDDLVTKGYRCDNGSFKPGTNLIIEKALTNIFPTCGIKANPHIDSKMKVLRKQYSIVYDMLSKSGFRWNNVKKYVEVDSEEVWQSYVQHHKEAEG
ncbi:Myb/SANT-like domain containing protein, partial [Parasponia andersonii]